ncbi:MAG: hypothetical protein AAFQ63_00105 [Cyanobacteria bacterium J06621_11]
MTSTTLFLQPINAIRYSPNFVNARAANVSFLNYSLPVKGALTTAESNTLVKGGVAAAIASANATFSRDPNFIELFGASTSTGVGVEDSYAGKSNSKTKVISTFDISRSHSLSFDFLTGIDIDAKEIKNPRAEYTKGKATTAFLLLDTSKKKARVAGYYGVKGKLISSRKVAEIRESPLKRLRGAIADVELTAAKNLGGNDDVDFLSLGISGRYQQTFRRDISEITLVQITRSATKFAGDTLIGNLGTRVTYGSIRRDKITGSRKDDRIYGSLGNDLLRGMGGDDILEGGSGNDRLSGHLGDDKINGGDGDDIISGGLGRNLLAGGNGADYFVFQRSKVGRIDTILDFEVGIDKIQRLGRSDRQNFLQNTIDTDAGAQFTSRMGGKILFSGLSVDQLSEASSLFA